MSEQIYLDAFGNTIVLVDEIRDVILTKHPEIAPFINQIGEVLKSPDEIRRSVYDERVVLYYCFKEQILDGKWLVVVVKRIDRNFVSTFYVTSKLKAGEVIWKK